MKHIFGVILTLLILLICSPSNVVAHPGNTDSSGGHTCQTNCSYWGYGYGEYHYHNGGYDDTDYYDQGSEAGSEYVDDNSAYIQSKADSEGSEEGKTDGEAGESENESPDPDSICSDVDFQNDSSPQDYYDGFMDSYSDRCQDLYNDKYSEAYTSAYTAGNEAYESDIKGEADDSSSNTTDWSGLVVVGVIFGALALIGNWKDIKKWWYDNF